MATVKNEVFIGLLHENFYLVGKEYIHLYIHTYELQNIFTSIISIVTQILRPTFFKQGIYKELLSWEVHF